MNRFELARYESGLTMGAAAEASKVSIGAIRALEEGRTKKPSAPIAKALAEAYGISVRDFLGVDEEVAAA